jgi:hypothetical protein
LAAVDYQPEAQHMPHGLSCGRYAILVTALLSTGCGSRADLASVRGMVTLDGQPVADAFVVYAPVSKGTTSYGRTDSSGHYEMMFSDREAGAWIGENLVRISTGDVSSGDRAGPKERVPAVYNQQTTLKADVKPGANTFDFELKSSAGKILAAPKE